MLARILTYVKLVPGSTSFYSFFIVEWNRGRAGSWERSLQWHLLNRTSLCILKQIIQWHVITMIHQSDDGIYAVIQSLYSDGLLSISDVCYQTWSMYVWDTSVLPYIYATSCHIPKSALSGAQDKISCFVSDIRSC